MISRRRFLQTNLSGLAAPAGRRFGPPDSSTPGQASDTVRPAFDRDYWNDWPRCFRARVEELRKRRKSELAAIHTPAQFHERAQKVRAAFWRLIGGPFQKTALNPQTSGVLQRDGYRIEKVIFESHPQVFVTSNLYVPSTGAPPFPGIISPLGHYPEGKAAHDYQHVYQNLARKGFVVLAFDPFSQGERAQFLEPKTRTPIYRDSDDGHDEAGEPLILLGGTFTQYRAWDAIRALDYLLTLPEVDGKRIGCVGHSGGATMTMFLCALEPRIQAAVIVEGHFRNYAGPGYEAPQGYGDAEQNLVGGLPLGLDRGDLVWSFAPKPVLLCYTPRDGIGWTTPAYQAAVQEIFDEARGAYRVLGAEDKIRLFASFLPHSFDFFNRRETYAWFNRWLGNAAAGTDEQPFDALPPGALNCTSTGQVLTSLGGISVARLTARRSASLIAADPFASVDAAGARRAQERVRNSLRRLLGLPASRAERRARTLSTADQHGLRLEEIELQSEQDIRLPGWFLKPARTSARLPAVLCFFERGKDELVADETNGLRALAEKGFAIFAADFRGSGDTEPRFPVAAPRNFPQRYWMARNYAYAGLAIGQPVLTQRVWDFLRCVDFLTSRPDVDAARIYVLGVRGGAVAALLGMALDTRPRALFCDGALADFRSVVETGKYTWRLEWLIPGFLLEMDLPAVMGAIAPRPLWLLNTVEARGETLPESTLRMRITSAAHAYAALNSSGKLQTVVEHESKRNQLLDDWLREM